jgi:hypothetical protein
MYEDELARTDTTQRLFDVLRVETRGGRRLQLQQNMSGRLPCTLQLRLGASVGVGWLL